MLFNEPKLLKSKTEEQKRDAERSFSALQRAEIAEIRLSRVSLRQKTISFSALQRAEIAEMGWSRICNRDSTEVSVLFNEPKLLKFRRTRAGPGRPVLRFSALQRAEIAEIKFVPGDAELHTPFQCSSTSRNC